VTQVEEERTRIEESMDVACGDMDLPGTQGSLILSKTGSPSVEDPLHMKVYEDEEEIVDVVGRDLPGDDVPVHSSSSTREVG